MQTGAITAYHIWKSYTESWRLIDGGTFHQLEEVHSLSWRNVTVSDRALIGISSNPGAEENPPPRLGSRLVSPGVKKAVGILAILGRLNQHSCAMPSMPFTKCTSSRSVTTAYFQS